jgi:hypothetical protein
MENKKKNVRVTRTTDRRSPKSVRHLGRALIALAQAQLEAEAEAQARAKTAHDSDKQARSKPTGEERHRPTGDAA